MKGINIGLVILVAIVAVGLVIFLISRNRKDRENLLPPNKLDDVSEKNRKDLDRRDEQL